MGLASFQNVLAWHISGCTDGIQFALWAGYFGIEQVSRLVDTLTLWALSVMDKSVLADQDMKPGLRMQIGYHVCVGKLIDALFLWQA